MRWLSAVGASALLLSCVIARPNIELSKTTVQVDRHRVALDRGEIIVRVQRTDDLFSDPTAHEAARLLLEKNTHIALRIQLDVNAGRVNVNDQPVDVLHATESGPRVMAIKAEALTLPSSHDTPVLDPETVRSLLGQMSRGIVGVEVKVESSPIGPRVPLPSASEDKDVAIQAQALSARQVSLWIRITEIEGQQLPHTTTTYTPILQLVVLGSGDKVHKIETLSIDGRPPVEQVAHLLPRPVMVDSLPPVEQKQAEEQTEESQDKHHHHHHHHHMDPWSAPHAHKPLGFWGWLKAIITGERSWKGLSKIRHAACKGRNAALRRLKAIQHGMDKEDNDEITSGEGPQKERLMKLVSHRVVMANPFSGLADDDEGYASSNEEYLKHHMHPHAHHGEKGAEVMEGNELEHDDEREHRHHHHKCGHYHFREHKKHRSRITRFFRRLAIGFVYGMALVGTVLIHPFTLLCVSVVAGSVFLFHVVRRMVVARRKGAIRLNEGDEIPFDENQQEKDVSEKNIPLLEGVVVEQTLT